MKLIYTLYMKKNKAYNIIKICFEHFYFNNFMNENIHYNDIMIERIWLKYKVYFFYIILNNSQNNFLRKKIIVVNFS